MPPEISPFVTLGGRFLPGEHLVDGQSYVVVHREPGQQRVVLEHDGAVRPGLVHLTAFEEHIALSGLGETGDDAEQRGLAAPGMTDDRDVFATPHVE
jgi:hypothetical protein